MTKQLISYLRLLSIASIIVCSVNCQDKSQKKDNTLVELAATPPLGFNSYDSYFTSLTEDKAKALIDVMAEKYKPFGYEYFVIDAGWYDNPVFYEGTKFPEKYLDDAIDEYGLAESSKAYFPGGIKALADYAHSKGLKFGVWIIRGIPKVAVERNLTIKGTKYTARDIADTTSICVWSDKNYGVDMSKPGAQEFYNSVIDKLASWGIDFIKVDDMVPYPKEITAVEEAIKQGGHKMLYSLSPGDVYAKSDLPYYRKAHMFRTTSDIWDNQLSIDRGFKSWEDMYGMASHFFWPDLDMIPFGRLRVNSPDNVDAVKEKSRQSLFTKDQMKTFITQRALAASPLFIGGDLLTIDDFSYTLLTDKEMLACNQNGVMGRNIYRKDSIDVWFTPNKNVPGKGWIGIFNRSGQPKNTNFSKTELGFTEFKRSYDLIENPRSFKVKNIWDSKEFIMDGNYKFSIPGNGVIFLHFEELN